MFASLLWKRCHDRLSCFTPQPSVTLIVVLSKHKLNLEWYQKPFWLLSFEIGVARWCILNTKWSWSFLLDTTRNEVVSFWITEKREMTKVVSTISEVKSNFSGCKLLKIKILMFCVKQISLMNGRVDGWPSGLKDWLKKFPIHHSTPEYQYRTLSVCDPVKPCHLNALTRAKKE